MPPFCCVAEIPIQHLSYHSERYGKFAIGFEREYLLGQKFRPVSYFLIEEDFMAPAVINVSQFVSHHRANPGAEQAIHHLSVLSAFVKSFTKEEFDTIYSEREWRRLREEEEIDFKFDSNKVKFVLSPKKYIQELRSTFGQKSPEANFLEYELLLEH
ncbi:MAG: abortive infection system antitoxin AbiGi family protein [Nitrospirae bacterium]|nr:abortive infection system antitoxin AbiGi family protein [Nitrospirota bacterium]